MQVRRTFWVWVGRMGRRLWRCLLVSSYGWERREIRRRSAGGRRVERRERWREEGEGGRRRNGRSPWRLLCARVASPRVPRPCGLLAVCGCIWWARCRSGSCMIADTCEHLVFIVVFDAMALDHLVLLWPTCVLVVVVSPLGECLLAALWPSSRAAMRPVFGLPARACCAVHDVSRCWPRHSSSWLDRCLGSRRIILFWLRHDLCLVTPSLLRGRSGLIILLSRVGYRGVLALVVSPLSECALARPCGRRPARLCGLVGLSAFVGSYMHEVFVLTPLACLISVHGPWRGRRC